MNRDPQTPEEWQQAVNMASVMLLIESARQYGLVVGGPEVNADRCQQLLDKGERRGYRPLPNSLENWFGE